MTKKKAKLTKFDMADYLINESAIRIFLADAAETGDPAYIAHALGCVARSRGMAKVAKKAGLSRESLYKALSKTGHPKFDTIMGVAHALDMRIEFVPLR